jgi:hypothetical protein
MPYGTGNVIIAFPPKIESLQGGPNPPKKKKKKLTQMCIRMNAWGKVQYVKQAKGSIACAIFLPLNGMRWSKKRWRKRRSNLTPSNPEV